jgi:hypothetical protein
MRDAVPKRFEPGIAFARRRPRHRHAEAVSAPWDRFDVGGPVRVDAKQPAQTGDCLLDAVVSNGHVLPAGLQEIVLSYDLTSLGDEQKQHVELVVRDGHGFSG